MLVFFLPSFFVSLASYASYCILQRTWRGRGWDRWSTVPIPKVALQKKKNQPGHKQRLSEGNGRLQEYIYAQGSYSVYRREGPGQINLFVIPASQPLSLRPCPSFVTSPPPLSSPVGLFAERPPICRICASFLFFFSDLSKSSHPSELVVYTCLRADVARVIEPFFFFHSCARQPEPHWTKLVAIKEMSRQQTWKTPNPQGFSRGPLLACEKSAESPPPPILSNRE